MHSLGFSPLSSVGYWFRRRKGEAWSKLSAIGRAGVIGIRPLEERKEGINLQRFRYYPVVIVPSALTRMDTPGRGVWAGPCTTLKLLAGSKMALCAGQTSCWLPLS